MVRRLSSCSATLTLLLFLGGCGNGADQGDLLQLPRETGESQAQTTSVNEEDVAEPQSLWIGDYQIYRTEREAWVFLDVCRDRTDTVARSGATSGGGGGVSERMEFHVFVVGERGVLHKCKSKSSSLTAHQNFAIFFRYREAVYGYRMDTGVLYRWETDEEGNAVFELTQERPPFLDSEREITFSLKENGNDLVLLESHCMGGMYEEHCCEVEPLKVRLRFGFGHAAHPWGACYLIAESLVPNSWKTTLLALPGCDEANAEHVKQLADEARR